MITRRTIYPGEPGSKKWQKLYGDKLLCVRYKYDEQNKKRNTRIELVADEQEWQPNKSFIPKNKIVNLRINYGEVDLARKVKSILELIKYARCFSFLFWQQQIHWS